MNTTAKTIGAVVGSVALLGSAAVAVLPVVMETGSSAPEAATEITQNTSGYSDLVKVSDVQGEFAFDQNKVTPNADIAGVFNKAASALCASLPNYNVATADKTIHVGGDVSNEFTATIDEMADSKGSQSYIMACACASNMPGGGAIANAEVEGVALDTVVTLAGVH